MTRWRPSLGAGVLGIGMLALSCGDNAAPTLPPEVPPTVTPPVEEETPPPFEGASAQSALGKVKYVLTGDAPTEAELSAVNADPAALRGLVEQWMERPEFQAKILGFFQTAFQQTQITTADLMDQLPTGLRGSGTTNARLMQNIRESYARTALQLVAEGRPFNETINSRRIMVTPPLAALYAYLDNRHINDRGGVLDRTLQQFPQFTFKVTTTAPVPLEETLNPQSPNYMTWYAGTKPPANFMPPCLVEPRVYTNTTVQLFNFLFGLVDTFGMCQQSYGTTPQFADAEFDEWRMVTIRRPEPGEQATPFYDLKALRTGKELVLRVPRVGFFSTPAFFANWATNSSNLARVTMNQTLIVALGKSFDDTNNTVPITEPALDAVHAGPDTECYGCHRTLDPMRQTFRQAYTLFYHEQLDPAQNLVNGTFAFGGVTKPLTSIYDMADTLATHPRFAAAWTQKLCQWANSSACVEEDPEFIRVADVFQKSGYNFKVLVKELMTSPLVTGLHRTMTSDKMGTTISIARREQLCAALSARLGVPDLCGLTTIAQSGTQRQISLLSSVIPSDGYSRGAEAATISNDPNLFFRASMENVCRIIAGQLVDVGMTPRYSSRKPQEAVTDMVHKVMGLAPGDTRAAPAKQILTEHFDEAVKSGKTPADALRSTFMLACMSPTAVSTGL